MREETGEAYRDQRAPGNGDEADRTIVIEDEALRRGFTQLPNYLFQVRGLSHSAKLTYALILSYAWQKDYCFPGQETLARDLEVSTRSVIEYLKELQARGLIRIQRRGLGLTNVYHVLRYPPAPTPETQPDPPRQPSAASYQEVKPSSHQGVKRRTGQDVTRASDADAKGGAAPEVQPSSANEDAPRAKGKPTKTERQQTVAASRRERDARPTKTTASSEAAIAPTDPASQALQAARTALQAYGVRGERLLAELTADPAEALAQVARLQQEIERGAVTNPAGWLVEAIRGRYHLPEQGGLYPDQPRQSAASPAYAATLQEEDNLGDDAPPAALAWRAVCAELRSGLTPDNYRHWFGPTAALSLDGDCLVVGVPNTFYLQWLDRRLRHAIDRAAARALGEVRIEFTVAGQASV